MTTPATALTSIGVMESGTPAAWSIGRRWFDFQAPMSTPLTIGSHVVITSADGARYLGQVTSTDVATGPAGRSLIGGGSLLAKSEDGSWGSVGTSDVFDTATIEIADGELVGDWISGKLGTTGTLAFGHGIHAEQVADVRLAGAGFNRHSFLCGQSGSGKTYTMGVLLEQLLLETELQLVILDPNSDYVGLADLGEPADDVDAARLQQLAGRVCIVRAGEGPHRLRVRFGRFPLSLKALVLALEPLRDADEYDLLRRTAEAIGGTEYSITDLRDRLGVASDAVSRRLAQRIDNLGVSQWGIWAERGEPPVLDQLPDDFRAAVIDLGSLDTPQERTAIAASLLSGLWARRHDRKPILVVIDEAHNVCPQEPTDHHQALAVEHAINIAAEGRKFGLYLLLATQRPQKLHVNVLSQCENLLLMHVNSLADMDYLASTFSHVPRQLIEQAPGFGLGEGLVAGRISPSPILFRGGRRRSPEGGGDVPTTWARRAELTP
jgi:uncharacterized protein